ncbi:MAG: hypothetical protein C0480_10115 [Bradyrhizobium sp.]|nr:hypothetical protein [Bradyrhizobium sp.]
MTRRAITVSRMRAPVSATSAATSLPVERELTEKEMMDLRLRVAERVKQHLRRVARNVPDPINAAALATVLTEVAADIPEPLRAETFRWVRAWLDAAEGRNR